MQVIYCFGEFFDGASKNLKLSAQKIKASKHIAI
jgi:hypothetical protein